MGDIKRQLIYKGLWRHTRVTLASVWFPSSKTCSACGTINRKLKRERTWTCDTCGTRHDRNLNAAINLRNLIMPVSRRRDGRGQEFLVPQQRDLPTLGAVNPGMERGRRRMRSKCGSGDHRKLIMPPRHGAGMGEAEEAVVQQRPSASCQGEPGIVKDVPPLRECGRGADGGTVVEGPARGSRDHRELTAAINPGNLVIPSGTGPGWARPSASCQGEPGIVKDMPPLRECGRGTDAGTEVEGHARGSGDHREPERGNQPEEPDHAPRHGAGMGEAGRP